jgi:hypothetical protein
LNYEPILLFITVIAISATLFIFFRKSKTTKTSTQRIPTSNDDKKINQIIIGTSPESPIVTIKALETDNRFENAEEFNFHDDNSINRFNSLFQAVPSLLTATESAGKQLYEVVINGELARAADGNGMRALSIGTDGKIQEHAKLFEAGKLQDMINAAAVWQIASVIVAQKHLADISAKLDEIKNSVLAISQFQKEQREARIKSIRDYLGQAYQALQYGEFSHAVRNHLESCEKDLLEIFSHLMSEYNRNLNIKVEHKETFGTKQLKEDIEKKMKNLDNLSQDITQCLKTRILGWHILSLFPGEPQLKLARRSSIKNSINEWSSLADNYKNSLTKEIDHIKAFWNTQKTLASKKETLQTSLQSSVEVFLTNTETTSRMLQQSVQLLIEYDRPTHLLLEYEEGNLINIRQSYTNAHN